MQSQIDIEYRTKLLESFRSGTNPFITASSENIYENLRQFATPPVDYYNNNAESIYENICHNCGRIYDDICGFCNDVPNTPRKNTHFIKKMFKHFKSRSLGRNNSKIRKSDICLVRDDEVFKVNCTFDMTEMSRLRSEFLTQHDDDDSGSAEVSYENLSFVVDDASVSSWITALGGSTEDESGVQYNVKAIPSKTFSESEFHAYDVVDEVGVAERLQKFIKSRKRPEKREEIKIYWRNNPFASPELTPLQPNLSDNFNECNLTTTCAVVVRHQDNDNALSVISREREEVVSNDIDLVVQFNNNNIRAFMRLNRLLLSISLNTITLSHDKYFKKIFHYWLKRDDNYLCRAEVSTSFNNSSFKSKVKVMETKNASINSPNEHTKTLTNTTTEPFTENTEVNNDIYYYIWNCDSSATSIDDQNWISAHEDFTSAADLMDIVDEKRSCESINVKIDRDSRNYSEVVIWYNFDNALDNRIFYEESKAINSAIPKKNESNENLAMNSNINDKKKRLDINFFSNSSVKEFLMSIRDTCDDEDEWTIYETQPIPPHEDHFKEQVKAEVVEVIDGNSNVSLKNAENDTPKQKYVKKKHGNEEIPSVKFDCPKDVPEKMQKIEQKSVKKKRGSKEDTKMHFPKDFPEKMSSKKEKMRQKSDNLKQKEQIELRGNSHQRGKNRTGSFNESDRQTYTERSNLRNAKSTNNLAELSLGDLKNEHLTFFEKIKNIFKKPSSMTVSPAPVTTKVYGNALRKLVMHKDFGVPVFVIACISELGDPNVIGTLGLYRASGNKLTIDEIKKKIDNSSSKTEKRFDCLKNQDANTLTGLLKQFFRELDPSLISHEVAQICVQDPYNTKQLRQQINTLGDYERSTLKYLIKHLTHVNQHKEANLMDSKNLSIVWGPCLFKSLHNAESMQSGIITNINHVVKTMIDNYEGIFEK